MNNGERNESAPDETTPQDRADEAVNETGEQAEEQRATAEASSEESSPDQDLESEVGRLRDALLRTRAEMDNMQKRGQRELDKARRFQVEALMRDLLPVIDGLEQGMENAGSEDQKAREGLELTYKLLLKALQDHGLEELDPVGEPFDPQWHEAMSMQPSDEAEPDTVLMVLQKGYRLHDRLLRAARVIVAKEAGESGDGD